MDLSIIILSFKSKEHLKVLLPSIQESKTRFSYEVIIVDNDSKDGTSEWVENELRSGRSDVKDFRLIRNINNGFSAGNNIGIRQSNGRFILLLNPDTKIEPDTIEVMIDFMEKNPAVGISGCKLIKADGTLDLACRRRFPNPWNALARFSAVSNTNYNYTDRDENVSMEVDSVVGAFMMIRRPVLELIGYLDESFFMYGEDLDWCWRCKEEGFKVWYYPKTFIHHYKGESSKKAPFRSLKWFHDAMWIFYKKHYADKYPFFFNCIVWGGIYSRLAVLILINKLKSEPRVSR